MSSSRRALLRAGLAAGSFLVTQAAPTAFAGGERASDTAAAADSLKAKAAGPSSEDLVQQELAEIVKYAFRLKDLRQDAPPAMCMPFALTAPCTFARNSLAALDIPAPNCPIIHERFSYSYTGAINEYLAHLVQELLPLTEAKEPVKTVAQFCDILPSFRRRVVSPMWMVDMEEPHFSPRLTATMLIDSVIGIINEWEHAINAVRDAANAQGNLNPVVVRRKPIECSIIREGFMLQFMAWQTGYSCAPGDG